MAIVGQRSISMLLGLTEYYRYTGDPAAIGIITMTADYLLDYCQTPADHPWPQFLHQLPDEGQGLWPGQPARLHPTGPLRPPRFGRACPPTR